MSLLNVAFFSQIVHISIHFIRNVLDDFYFCFVRFPVAQSIEHWTCDRKVAGLNLGLEGPCGRTISIFSVPCAFPVFRKRYNIEAPNQSPNVAGFLN